MCSTDQFDMVSQYNNLIITTFSFNGFSLFLLISFNMLNIIFKLSKVSWLASDQGRGPFLIFFPCDVCLGIPFHCLLFFQFFFKDSSPYERKVSFYPFPRLNYLWDNLHMASCYKEIVEYLALFRLIYLALFPNVFSYEPYASFELQFFISLTCKGE